jgi:hypothetical protein
MNKVVVRSQTVTKLTASVLFIYKGQFQTGATHRHRDFWEECISVSQPLSEVAMNQ